MSLPLPRPSYQLLSTLKIGDTVTAYCDLTASTVKGTALRPVGVNVWEMAVDGTKDKFRVTPDNIVGVIRAPENRRHVSDKPPKEPKPKKARRESEEVQRAVCKLLERLTESDDEDDTEPVPIRGEYWWHDGELEYADGNMGDRNHEGIATEHAQYLLCDAFGLYLEDIDQEDVAGEIVRHLEEEDPDGLEQVRAGSIADWEAVQRYAESKLDTCFSRDVMMAAMGIGDSRAVAVREWGWIRIKGPHVDAPDTLPATCRSIYRAISEAIDTEGAETDSDINNDSKWFVHVYPDREGGSYTPSLASLSTGRIEDVGEDPALAAAQKAAEIQTADLDKKSMHAHPAMI